MWKKLGRIWASGEGSEWSHTQVPVVDTGYLDRWRIFYASRSAQNQSHIFYIDVEPGNPRKILGKSPKAFLGPGKVGHFDDCGVMPTCVVGHRGKKFLYYIGWTRKVTVPYQNSIGLAVIDEKGKIDRLPGPVVGQSWQDPVFQGTAFVMKGSQGWKMWYLSATHWEQGPQGGLEPVYHIKYASSDDGVNWAIRGQPCLRLAEGEGGIASASVVKESDTIWHMWYSVRGKFEYRDNKGAAYRLGYASSLFPGEGWVRADNRVGISKSEQGWDSQMMCYPYVIRHKGKLFMFYNGNGFGRSGFGCAAREFFK